MNSPHPSRNLAARMALWSAHHRKMAIFGWLGFVVALFAISIVSPMKQIVYETSGPGESGRADDDPLRGLQAARRRERPDPERLADGATTPPFKAAVAGGRSPVVSTLDAVAKVESPLDAENSGPDLGRRALGARPDGDPRASPMTPADKIDPIVAARRRGADGTSRASTSARSARAPTRRSRRRSWTT